MNKWVNGLHEYEAYINWDIAKANNVRTSGKCRESGRIKRRRRRPISNVKFEFSISNFPRFSRPFISISLLYEQNPLSSFSFKSSKFLVPSLAAKLKIGPPQILSQGKQIGPKLSHVRVNWGAELTLDHLVMIQHLFLGTHLKTQVLR